MMGKKSSNAIYILKDAVSAIRENLGTTILTSFTLGFSIAIFTLFLFVFININAAVNTWGDRTHIVAYVKDDTSYMPEEIRETLRKIPGVKGAEFISKEAALKELKDELKGYESILEGVDSNPLPASFEIKIDETHREAAALMSIVDEIKKAGWSSDVQYSQEWVEKFSSFLKFIELAAMGMGVFLAAATLFIISNTIRLTVYARKEEIEIMKLVGASDAFIKVPFFIEGVLQGLFGGLLAFGALALGRYLLISKIPPYFSFILDSPYPAPTVVVIILVSGIVMGVAGSLITMGKFLKV